jgi:hypothetical protein
MNDAGAAPKALPKNGFAAIGEGAAGADDGAWNATGAGSSCNAAGARNGF